MIRQKRLLLLFAWLLFLIGSFQKLRAQEWPPLASKEWIREHLNPEKPRLIFTRAAERQLREKLGSDSLVAELYAHIKAYADELLNLPPLTYQKRGRRLLRVSRDAISRTLALAMAYRIEGNISYRQRLEAELANISTFPDWNPAHFLDAAEMAVAVSLPLDWCGADLSPAVRSLARSALVEKALKPGLGVTEMNWWWDAVHNWNLVCHGGLAIAALVLFEEEPDLASHTLHRTVTKFPLGFSPYEPDGAYTEGPSYWFYATDYLTLAISAFESALGADFGFTNAPGIKESALFSEIAAGPSGDYYNYFDASTGGYHSLSHLGLLTWFAPRTGFAAPRQAWKKAIADETNRCPRLMMIKRTVAMPVFKTRSPRIKSAVRMASGVSTSSKTMLAPNVVDAPDVPIDEIRHHQRTIRCHRHVNRADQAGDERFRHIGRPRFRVSGHEARIDVDDALAAFNRVPDGDEQGVVVILRESRAGVGDQPARDGIRRQQQQFRQHVEFGRRERAFGATAQPPVGEAIVTTCL